MRFSVKRRSMDILAALYMSLFLLGVLALSSKGPKTETKKPVAESAMEDRSFRAPNVDMKAFFPSEPPSAPAPRQVRRRVAPPKSRLAIPAVASTDADALRAFFAADVLEPHTAWFTDLLTDPAAHPLVSLRVTDEAVAPFAYTFDTRTRRLIITVKRSTLLGQSSGGAVLTATERRIARLLAVRSGTLAHALEKDSRLESYIACALHEAPSQACFLILTIPHLMAAEAEWRYALDRNEEGVLGEGVVRGLMVRHQLGMEFRKSFRDAIMVQLVGTELATIFWAERYDVYFDILNLEDQALREQHAMLKRAGKLPVPSPPASLP